MCAARCHSPPSPAALDREVGVFQSLCFANTTKRAYSTHLKSYITFCNQLGVPTTPATSNTLCRYVAYLSHRLSFNSIKQYINVVRILHLSRGLPNPLEGDFSLSTTLRGIRRHLGDKVHRKVPITPRLLLCLLRGLNLSLHKDALVWAAALLMFFGLLRRSHVCISSLKEFNHLVHLRRRDLSFSQTGLSVTIRWSKTNQFRTTQAVIPYPRIKGHALCPTRAVFHAISLSPSAPLDGPALVLPGPNHTPLPPVTFVNRVRQILATEVPDVTEIGGHSFRRGGACHMLARQVPIDSIRQLAGWSSNCYTAYVLQDTAGLRRATEAMCVNLPTTI